MPDYPNGPTKVFAQCMINADYIDLNKITII